MSSYTNFSPYTAAPEENRGAYQPIGDGPSKPNYAQPGNSRTTTQAEEGNAVFNVSETSLPVPYEIEAALTYIFGCISGVIFLITEQKNDYVRFHAWQACILGVISLIAHLFIGLLSNFLFWTLFLASTVLSFFLAFRAYSDAGSLVRYQLPYIGIYAAKWTDEE